MYIMQLTASEPRERHNKLSTVHGPMYLQACCGFMREPEGLIPAHVNYDVYTQLSFLLRIITYNIGLAD
jgi:hypothetical protein